MKRLARKAVELGLEGKFADGVSVDDVLASLEQMGAPGKEWLGELEKSRNPWFNVNVGDGFYHYHRSWNDDLSLPFSAIPGYAAKIKAGDNLDRPIEKLQAERHDLIDGYRELLSTDEERAAYDQMIELACRVFPYVEGHKFYCEHWYTNLFFNKIREFGDLLVEHDMIDAQEDSFHLSHYELEQAIVDVPTSWSNGSPTRGAKRFRKMVAERPKAIKI